MCGLLLNIGVMLGWKHDNVCVDFVGIKKADLKVEVLL